MTWKRAFKMKDLLTPEDVPPERAKEAGREVARRLTAERPFSPDINDDLCTRFNDVEDQEEFNDVLNDLYDAGDDERVWIE